MRVQFLVSTMFQKDRKLHERMNIKTQAIIVNQNDDLEECKKIQNGSKLVEYISVVDRGLSKSRNLAIRNADAEICIIADDDLYYYDDVEKIVCEAYRKYPDADVIAFNIENHKDSLLSMNKVVSVNFLYAMKLSSVQLTFKMDKIKSKDLYFDEKFGAGAEFICGEENIFIKNCINLGLNIIYIPVPIGKLLESESTWFQGYNESYFITKGALFTELSRRYSLILMIQFVLRKHHIYSKDTNMISALKLMLEGRKFYLKEHKGKTLWR